ncbi:MAG: hypothetical protein ACRCXX_14430 [Cetobacterium sp.]|uniref:hypothetical protein n=1 Tax=Cetobacterium sp. TaxID=2071632 RepID=UPI003F2DE482
MKIAQILFFSSITLIVISAYGSSYDKAYKGKSPRLIWAILAITGGSLLCIFLIVGAIIIERRGL